MYGYWERRDIPIILKGRRCQQDGMTGISRHLY